MAATLAQRLKTAFGSRLGRTRFSVRITMLFERLWPLVLPSLLVVGLFVATSWLGLFRLMPDWLRLGALGLFALAGLAGLYPLRFFRNPDRIEIDRRIERANRLQHAPVLTQADRLPDNAGGGFAEALWREHQRRMAARLEHLSGDMPRSRVPERDPWALRAVVGLLLVVAFAFSYGPLGGRLADGFRSHGGAASVAARVDAWVTPPSYTGRAPLYLTADANSQRDMFRVPEGSEVTIRVTGGSGEEQLFSASDRTGEETQVEPAEAVAARAGAGASSQFAMRLSADGALRLTEANGAAIRQWAFAIVPDQPPVIRFAEDPRRAANGALELRYEIEDDYGAVSAEARFEQAEGQAGDARALYDAPDMPLSLPRGRDGASAARTSRDLTEHPWAGSVVDVTLAAHDAAGQEGLSDTQSFRLPERAFSNPLARALVEQRRILALDADAGPRVLDMMDGLTLRPEDTIDAMAHYLGIKAARTRLSMARSDDQLRAVVDFLWEIALTIEDGALSAAERRLQQAQEALRQALEDGAGDEEIEDLMAELREAMQEFLRELAERAQQNLDSAMQMPGQGQELRQSDLERMLDQIEDMARSGAREQAQDMLAQLQDMMNNLQANRQPQQGQGQQGEMQQQMDQLGDIMRRQQEMMNETFSLDQMQRGELGQQGEQDGRPMSPEDFADAMRDLQEGQGQLQQDLEALAEALEGMGLDPGEGMDQAGEAMGRAEGALGEQMGERAVGEQGQALQALRQGAQEMMQQLQQAMEGQQGGSEDQGQQGAEDRDPLGRPRATTGPDFGESVRVPDEADVQRAREILDEIRRRLGNTLSPEIERDYLERLLDMR